MNAPAEPIAYDFELDLRVWADLYASAGWPVFPLHSPKRADRLHNLPKQRCDCKYADACKDPAKHPRTEHGLSDASLDEAQIARWWSMWPRANVGIAVPSGFVVVDIDGPEGLDALASRQCTLPSTVCATTARGFHYWFAATDREFRPKVALLEHVDLRGPGSYVVAPPSLHATGVQYSWEQNPAERNWTFAAAPMWLGELVDETRARSRQQPSDAVEGDIGEGSRNPTLTRMAGAMRRIGFSEEAMLLALGYENMTRCKPPLDENDVAKIAHSVARYAPQAESKQTWEREPW